MALHVVLLWVCLVFALPCPGRAWAAEPPLRVALVLETPLGDNGWNDALAAGLERAEQDFAVRASLLPPPPGEDGAALAERFRAAARENDLVLVASDRLHEILRDNAGNFRRTRFGCIDAGIRAPNIMSVTYADEQAAFLAGAAAAMLARSTGLPGIREGRALGWLSGEDVPAMRSLFNGFAEGARVVDPSIRVLHAVAGSFADAQAGRREARRLLREADVLVLASGMGNAPALEEVRAANAYAVGMDVDQDARLPGRVLTSILKHPDRAVYDLVAAAATGHFQGKQILVRTLDNGGVGLTDMRLFRARGGARLADDIDRRLKELRHEIRTGGVRLKSLRARTLCDCL